MLTRPANSILDAGSRNPLPAVSVIMAVHNGAAHLARSVQSVLGSHYPKLELIVIDDASTDGSEKIANQFPCRVLSLRNRSGPGYARNIGAAMACGAILFFTDVDVLIDRKAIAQAVSYLEEHPSVCAVIGTYTAQTPAQNFVSVHKNLVHHFVHHQSQGPVASFFTACGAIRREAFERFGGFDTSEKDCALEDVELGFRLFIAGEVIVELPVMQAVHLKRYTFATLVHSDLWQRAVPYTVYLLRYRIMPNEMSTTRGHRISVVLAYSICILAAAALLTRAVSYGICVLAALGFYLLTNRRFYAFVLQHKGFKFLLPSALFHFLTYIYGGIGFVIGLLLFLRWEVASRVAVRFSSKASARTENCPWTQEKSLSSIVHCEMGNKQQAFSSVAKKSF